MDLSLGSMGGATSSKRIPAWLGLLPAWLWFFFFLLIPAGFVLVYSLAHRGPYGGILMDELSVANFSRALDPLYGAVLWNSVKLAAATTFLCLLVGFPMAWLLAISPAPWRNWLVLAVVVPFWTNFVVRVYAVKLLLSEQGPVQALLGAMRISWVPEALGPGPLAVLIGMVTNYLPFLVLPLWVSIEKFDFSLLEAARDLGASRRAAFVRVLLPQIRAGLISGMVFVFTPALGEFVIPDLLGGARTMLVGNLVTEQFLKVRDWPFGAAISVILVGLVLGASALGGWFSRRKWGGA